MERTMSVEEKIRRAEEIYNRRAYGEDYLEKKSRENKKKHSLMRKFIKQMIMCMIVYIIFYCISNKDYILSDEFQSKIQEITSKNELMNNTYNYIYKYIKGFIKDDNEEKEDSSDNKNNIIEQKMSEENIGGAEEKIDPIENTEEKELKEIEITTSFIIPVEGTVSSGFGWRTPTTSTVPKYHTGIDISAPTGAIIKSATDGKVSLASSQGDYGKHYKISIGDITIIYAHCSKLYLKEGDSVYQGQEIAEVGSTGNSTRTTFTL